VTDLRSACLVNHKGHEGDVTDLRSACLVNNKSQERSNSLRRTTTMDAHHESLLEQIKTDASLIQSVLQSTDNDVRSQVAREAGARIVSCCERLAKRTRRRSPSPEQDERGQEKLLLTAQSEVAGRSVLPFGKHKGKAINTTPLSYLSWLLGLRREGREFEIIPTDKHGWILANHPDTIAQVKAYLTWRCWACRSTETRFKFSRLCPECWHHPSV